LSPDHLSHGLGHLADVRVQEINFRRNDAFDFGSPLNYKIVTSSTVELADDLTSGTVFHTAKVAWVRDDTAELQLGPFELNMTLGAFFVLHAKQPDEDELAAWIEINSEHLLWPYLRAEIAGLTTAAGLPPLTIYTISVPTIDRDPNNDPDELRLAPESAGLPESQG
jgi:hypothetical protein